MTAVAGDYNPTEHVLQRLQDGGYRTQRAPGGWTAQCPAHDDRNPSMSLGTGKDGRALIHCHAGCSIVDILNALELPTGAIFTDWDPYKTNSGTITSLRAWRQAKAKAPKQPSPYRREKTDHWDYHDAQGVHVARVVRYQLVDPDTGEIVGKTFTQHAWDAEHDRQQPNLGGIDVPLYRLPQVRDGITAGHLVMVCEGERDADTATAAGYIGTTAAMGAGSWRPHHTEQLAGAALVVVMADDDDPGRAHAATVAASLTSAGIKATIRLPAQGCKDLTAHIDAGHALGDLRAWEPELDDTTNPDLGPEPDAAAEPDDERTSWWPRDIAATINGEHTEPPPEHLRRGDGHALSYVGRVNGIIGESESGKTWIALLAVRQALQHGQRVLYLDFEDSAAGVIGRLILMGCSARSMATLTYVAPDESLHDAARGDLFEIIETSAPDLVVVDGFNAAMTLLGLEVNSNSDATAFSQQLLKPLASTGAAVLYVDHVPKSKEARGKGGIGAQAKRAMTTGCAILAEVIEQPGKGRIGKLRLTVDKDRPGLVREVASEGNHAGIVVIDGTDPGKVTVTIEAPDLRPADERGAFRPTGRMQDVSMLLEQLPDGASKAQIEANVPGRRDITRAAVDALVSEGYATIGPGARNAIVVKSVAPYRQDGVTEWKP